MWKWIAGALGIIVTVYLIFWIRNIARSVKSGDFAERLEAVRQGKSLSPLEQSIKEEQAKANITPESAPDIPSLSGMYPPWVAVSATDPRAVVAALDFVDAVPCNWESASKIFQSLFNDRVFVSSPVDGWILIAGNLPTPDPEMPQEGIWNLLIELSNRFGEAQYFYMSNSTLANCWALARNGEMIRAYCFTTDAPKPAIVWNDGAITEGERNAGYVYGESGYKGTIDPDEVDEHPDCCRFEEAIGDISAQWSFDPERLYEREDLVPGAGFMGRLNSLQVKNSAGTGL